MILSISYLNTVFLLHMNDKTSFTLKCHQNELGDAPAASPNPLYLRSEFAIFDLRFNPYIIFPLLQKYADPVLACCFTIPPLFMGQI